MIEDIQIASSSSSNPELRILFASATKNKDADSILPLCSLRKMKMPSDVQIDFCALTENGKGLSEAYNDVLDSRSGRYDIVVLVHDDLDIIDVNAIQTLAKARWDGTDLVGIAGGKGWSIPHGGSPYRPIGWTTASRDAGMAGMVIHVDDGGVRRFASSYGPCPARTLTVDGCFMAMMNSGLSLRFDQQFSFNHYDMDISFQAYRKGMKTAVYPILCTHMSQGKGLLKPEYIDSQMLFLKKWFV